MTEQKCMTTIEMIQDENVELRNRLMIVQQRAEQAEHERDELTANGTKEEVQQDMDQDMKDNLEKLVRISSEIWAHDEDESELIIKWLNEEGFSIVEVGETLDLEGNIAIKILFD